MPLHLAILRTINLLELRYVILGICRHGQRNCLTHAHLPEALNLEASKPRLNDCFARQKSDALFLRLWHRLGRGLVDGVLAVDNPLL